MATLTGKSIATTYDQLWFRGTTEPSGTTGAVNVLTTENDGTDDLSTPLYLGTARIGIGTSAPSQLLDIAHATGGYINFHREDTAISDDDALGGIYWTSDGDGSSTSDRNIGARIVAYADAAWDTGTDVHKAASKLVFFTQDASTTDTTDTLAEGRMTIDKDGKVGIGRPDPSYLLDVCTNNVDDQTLFRLREDSSDDAMEFFIELSDTGITGLTGKNTVLRGGSSQSDMIFSPSSDTPGALVIKDGGKIGIGEVAPDSLLHIKAGNSAPSANTSGTVKIEETGSGVKSMVVFEAVAANAGAGNKGAIMFDAGATGSTANNRLSLSASTQDEIAEDFVILGDGKVGIGGTPTYLSHIKGVEAGEGTALGQLAIQSSTVFGSTPDAGIIFINEHTTGSQAIMGGIKVTKSNTGDADVDSTMSLQVRKHGAVAFDGLRINENGNVGIGAVSFQAAATGQLVLQNGTSPGAHTDDQIYIGSRNSTGLATDGSTLALFIEGTVQNTALDAVGTLSHRITIWVNDTEYYLYLDPV